MMDQSAGNGSDSESTANGGRVGGLLLRHPSQSSLDESSQRNPSNSPEEDDFKPPYKNVSHFEKAFGILDNLRKNRMLIDVTLVAEGVEVPAHRTVLASSSPYFAAMFSSFEERAKERVEILGVEAGALASLIDYAYTGSISIMEDSVTSLLPAARLLQMVDVSEACEEFLKGQLHPSNCLGIRAFADLHACTELLAAADNFTCMHFTEVVDGEEFLSLTPQQVGLLIGSDELAVAQEETVFESVCAWVNHDLEKRADFIASLMAHVRLPLFSPDYLCRIDEEPLVKRSPQCKDLIIEALKLTILRQEGRPTFASPRARPRAPLGLPKVLLVVGGQAPKAIRCVEAHDLKDDRWRLLADMPTRRCRAGLAVLAGKVYAVGGFNGSLRVKTVDVYDPASGKWLPAPAMNARRSTLGVAVLGTRIYAVGGFDGSTGLNSVEAYDSIKKEWIQIASMSTRRSSVGVGVLQNKLYAVGGYDGASRQCLSSVEVYDPDRDEWSCVADMSARRSGAGVGVVGDLLYAVGGHDGPIVRKSVEVFNGTTRTWSPVADMTTCRRNAGVVSHLGFLYVVGGDDGTCNLPSVEVYDPKTDTWRLLSSSMVVGRSYAGVAVIDKPIGYQ